ncbi:MAG: hypothetical protein HC888_07895 [Candidatus Competibacteraceae bacterium]|nr:hypothetical protein [Candidatus Competibacteraceae bacterium]
MPRTFLGNRLLWVTAPELIQRVLLDDAYEHREVAFRPGHDELLFRTRIRIDQPKGSMLVVHALPLGD